MKLKSAPMYERWIDGDPCQHPGCEGGATSVLLTKPCRGCGGTGKKPVAGWATEDMPRETCPICEGAKELEETARVSCGVCQGAGMVNQRSYILLPSGEMIPDPAGSGAPLAWEVWSTTTRPGPPPESAATAFGPWFPFMCRVGETALLRRCVIYGPPLPPVDPFAGKD